MEDALTVEYSAHNGDKNNKDDYNKSFNGSEMTAEKAGDDYVNKTYTDNRQNVYLVKQATGNPSRNVKISMICSIQPHIMRSLWILMPNAKGAGFFNVG